MLAYNHEHYIEQAVLSAISQETSFDYEVIVGEDCSSDKTREILLGLKQQYPDKINLLLNDTNQGMARNFRNVWGMCKGEYIAWLEGDDYWTSPSKLEIQSRFLDKNPECIICFHDVDELYVDIKRGSRFERNKQNRDRFYSLDNLLKEEIFLPTPSAMVRRTVEQLPNWFEQLKAMADYPHYIFLLQSKGSIGYIAGTTMATYRFHSSGASNQLSVSGQAKMNEGLANDWDLLLLNCSFHSEHTRLIKNKIFSNLVHATIGHVRNNDEIRAKMIIKQHLFQLRWLSYCSLRSHVPLLLKIYFPKVYDLFRPLKWLVR